MALRIFTEPQQGASYDELLAVAQLAESSGFDAFFRSDHVLKMGDVSGLPGVTDAWITLAGLARDTSTIRLGTLVTPVTFRHPGLFAVTAAQVDQMSGGRVEIGLGAGWYGAEHEAFAITFPELARRYDLLEDQLALLHGAWTAANGSSFEHTGPSATVSIAAELNRRAAAIGRDLDELRTNGLAGTPNELLDKLNDFASQGIDRFYLQVLDLTDLDHLRLIAEAVQPHAPGS